MPNHTGFVPRWAREREADYAALAETPNTGVQGEFAPRLPTRLIPFDSRNAVSSITLSDTIICTQRILSYVSYEVVHGMKTDGAPVDLRKAAEDVLRLGRLEIEPFEEGSFVIPAKLPEDEIEIGGTKYSSAMVLERFAQVMANISTSKRPVWRHTEGKNATEAFVYEDFAVSTELLQAVEDLGRITRREAAIEYAPIWSGARSLAQRPRFIVNSDFISTATELKTLRQNRTSKMDSLDGLLTALDVEKGTLSLRLSKRKTIRGTFGPLAQERLIRGFNRRVRLHGVVRFIRSKPDSIRTFVADVLDEDGPARDADIE